MTYKLSKVIFYLILSISLFSILIIEIFDISYEYDDFEKSTRQLKENFIKKEKKELQIEVDRAISLIEFNYSLRINRIRKHVKQRVYEAHEIATNIYNKYKDTKSKKEITTIIKDTLRDMRFFDGLGYYFLYDFTGKTLVHGVMPEYENTYKLKDFKDSTGKNVVSELLTIAKTKKEGYLDWTFYRPDKKDVQGYKKGYIKVFEPYNFIIITADYLFRVDEQLKREALDRIRNITLSNKGYIFVLNKKGKILVNRYSKNHEGKHYSQLDDKKAKEIISKIVSMKSDDAFLEYNWKQPLTGEYKEKLSYVKKYEKWDWIIGTGTYLDNMYSLIENEKTKLEDKTLFRLEYSAYIFLVMILLIIFVTRVITKNMDNTFSLFIEFFKKANTNNEKIELEKINFKEFNELALCANQMINNKLEDEKVIDSKSKEVLINHSLLNEYKKAVDASAIVSKTDINGVITFANDEFCKISGYSRDELIGKKHNIVKDFASKINIYNSLWKTILDKRIWKGVIKNRNKSGKAYYVKSTVVPILDVHGEIKEFMAIRYNVTDLIKQSKRIKLQTTDHLTQLPNRQKLLEDLEDKHNLRLAIFNLTRFKEVNEYYGFEVGDKLLIEVANTLSGFIHDKKLSLYKLQGDEFAILNIKGYSLEEFKSFTFHIIEEFKKLHFEVEGNRLDMHIIAGVSSEKNYYINAEMAKNHAKNDNKELVVFDENKDIKENLANNINWTQKLKMALKEDRLEVFIQPIISNEDGKISKYECLVRMIDEDGKIISPIKFLHVAKKSKLYSQLTRKVIEKSFEYFANRKDDFSINLTIEDILDESTVTFLEQQLRRYNDISQRLILEIVEDEGIENYQEVSSFIETMKYLGCRIAIDDFGTGYSNFDYLMKLNVDFVKVDGSMIKHLNKDANAKIVTELIVSFAKQLKIKTIAEFVHSEEIHDIVTDMGIDYSQGFYLGTPKQIGSDIE